VEAPGNRRVLRTERRQAAGRIGRCDRAGAAEGAPNGRAGSVVREV